MTNPVSATAIDAVPLQLPTEATPVTRSGEVAARRAYIAIALTVAISTVWVFLAGPRQYLVTYWPDDALFYNIVARNIVDGLGSTSDGIAFTNGYHPLWMGVHVALERLSSDPIAVQVLLQAALLTLALCLLFDYVATLTNRTIALALCVVAASEQTFIRVLASGMETNLAFIALLLVLRTLQQRRWQTMSVAEQAGLSAGLGLLFFSRLDGALLWVALSLLVLSGWSLDAAPFGRRVSFLRRIFSVPALLAGIYFLLNQVWFGSAMPVSGRVKSVPLAELADLDHLRNGLHRLAVLYRIDTLSSLQAVLGGTVTIILVVLLLAAAFGIVRLLRRGIDDGSVRLLLAYVALHTFYYVALQQDSVSMQWARGPELLLMSVGLAAVCSDLMQGVARPCRRGWLTVSIVVPLMLGSIAYNGLKATKLDLVRDYSVRTVDFWAAVDVIRATVPADAVVASHAIGFIGYFSERRVLSVDGLLNSTEYYRDYLRSNRKLDYIKAHGVRYSINAIPGGQDPIRFLRDYYYPGLRSDDVRIVRMFGDSRDSGGPWNYALFQLTY
jgi:hypothetical protein